MYIYVCALARIIVSAAKLYVYIYTGQDAYTERVWNFRVWLIYMRIYNSEMTILGVCLMKVNILRRIITDFFLFFYYLLFIDAWLKDSFLLIVRVRGNDLKIKFNRFGVLELLGKISFRAQSG